MKTYHLLFCVPEQLQNLRVVLDRLREARVIALDHLVDQRDQSLLLITQLQANNTD